MGDLNRKRTVSSDMVVNAKNQAAFDAVKWHYTQVYKQKMRYDIRSMQECFGLADFDVEFLEEHWKDTDDYDLYMVTVNLNLDKLMYIGGKVDHHIALKATTKKYINECSVAFEMGKEGTHPHYHFLFTKRVAWLAKSRIIDEFSKTFHIDKNYVDVKMYNLNQKDKLIKYIRKEQLWFYQNWKEKKSL